MMQDENQKSRSNRRTKSREKKIPQRGLGVAQLEKLRMEEMQKQQSRTLSLQKSLPFAPLPIPVTTSSATSLVLNPSNFHHFSPNIRCSESPAMESSCLANVGSQVVMPPPAWPAMPPGSGENSSHRDPEVMKKTDYFPFGSPFTCDSLSQSIIRRNPHSLVAPTPSSSSGVNNLQMEPPSNQSYSSNKPPWTIEEDRIIGIKRPWPLFQENQSLHLPRNKSPNLGIHHEPSKLEENSVFRDHCSSSMHLQSGVTVNWRNSLGSQVDQGSYSTLRPSFEPVADRRRESVDGAFLTLAPSNSSMNPTINPHYTMDFAKYHVNPRSTVDVANHHQYQTQEFIGNIERERKEKGVRFIPFISPGPSKVKPPNSEDRRESNEEPSVDLNLKL
ncbi:uncharacterized protein LOC110007912 [Amborella trichopoda]|uniref:Uncharacterized protein n=1 Tax=Amborella trichopoda TaxID=13333 RepID=W1Q0D9_AMBTC|nr:uncharacterized protein LOC110007912 [Amborella trichopoda]ERN13979.1 hypothetical protein AMTR_s00021p00163900 [Amborella trichopoda]|eukprot:XP_020527778.1 uncharacterized protein LOC110007912 [Amborella trichopoda]